MGWEMILCKEFRLLRDPAFQFDCKFIKRYSALPRYLFFGKNLSHQIQLKWSHHSNHFYFTLFKRQIISRIFCVFARKEKMYHCCTKLSMHIYTIVLLNYL